MTREELLVLLIEECSEVIHAATKCLRFGYDIDHKTGYGNNRLVLSGEIGDLMGIINSLDIDTTIVDQRSEDKITKCEYMKSTYT